MADSMSRPAPPPRPLLDRTRVVSIVLWGALALALWPAFRWLLIDAQFQGNAAACRASGGACWAFVIEKLPFLAYGFLVSEVGWAQHLFVTLALVKFLLLFAVPLIGLRALIPIVLMQAFTVIMVLAPGLIGAAPLSGRWSGLLLTLSLMLDALPMALLLGIFMALARTSRFALLRAAVGFLVDACRAIPLVAILFFAAVVVPNFLAEPLTPNKLARGWLTFTVFAACYFCEAVRGGLAALSHGQIDGAQSLGLRNWHVALLIRLPQALATAWPAITSNLVAFTKDSSLISIIGVTELFSAMRFSLSDPAWLGFVIEGYVFVGLIYFALCQFVILWGRTLERRLFPSILRT